MNYGIQYLAHLVQIKNDLNRKRRRLYHLAWPTAKYKVKEYNIWETQVEIKPKRHKTFTKTYAKKMYKLTQLEMKAMTAEMSRARKEINARLVWTSHGAISAIECGEQRYDIKIIARLAELYKADAIFLGD